MEASKRMSSQVQLGFSVEFDDEEHRDFVGHNLPLWRDWDGGQIGGRPSWLQPRDIPQDFIKCENCEEPMCFLCQLYAPADEVNPNAFHRSLYVFGCPSVACGKTSEGSIRVLRTQLPRENVFYPEDKEDNTWAMHLPEAWDVELCKVCGQRGKGKCPIQGYSFCGKHHQKEHKKFVFDKIQQLSKNLEFNFLPSVCAESELVVEEEPSNTHAEEEAISRAEEALFKDGGNAEEDEEDGKLEQQDLNEMVGAKEESVSKDPVTMTFFARIQSVPNIQEQCLRYLRWPHDDVAFETCTPLWIRSDSPPPTKIPKCKCGADRAFEFQLMPQMLHYLLKDHEIQKSQAELKNRIRATEVKEAVMKASGIIEQAPSEHVSPALVDAKEKAVEQVRKKLMGEDGDKELSWGVVSVYTCTESCGNDILQNDSTLGAYREEYAWKQPSLD